MACVLNFLSPCLMYRGSSPYGSNSGLKFCYGHNSDWEFEDVMTYQETLIFQGYEKSGLPLCWEIFPRFLPRGYPCPCPVYVTGVRRRRLSLLLSQHVTESWPEERVTYLKGVVDVGGEAPGSRTEWYLLKKIDIRMTTRVLTEKQKPLN